MNYKFTNVIVFAAGAAIGSAVTWKILKDHYEKLVQEEIKSVKEAFSNHPVEQDTDDTTEDEDEGDPSQMHIDWSDFEDLDEDEDEDEPDDGLSDYERLVNKYTNEKGGADNMARAPYIIAPYDFGELDGYNQIELTYYEGDDVLEDDEYNIIEDRDELLGIGALNTFGEYEDDAVFVRNERLRTDFQILKDYRTYEEARSISPARVDNE